MKYAKRSSYGIFVLEKQIGTNIQKGLIEYVNSLCLKSLSTYDGRIKSVKKVLSISSLIPVFVNDENLLFPTESIRNYDCVFINYCRVLSIKKRGEEALVTFQDLSEIVVDVSFNRIKKQIEKCEIISQYLNQIK